MQEALRLAWQVEPRVAEADFPDTGRRALELIDGLTATSHGEDAASQEREIRDGRHQPQHVPRGQVRNADIQRQTASPSITRLFWSTRRVPLDVSRITRTLSQGSTTTAQRPIWISNGPLRTVPPATVNLARASGTEATTRSVSMGLRSVCRTNSASDPGSFNPAAVLLRQRSSCPRLVE